MFLLRKWLGLFPSHRPATFDSHRARPALESLEDRRLMSANLGLLGNGNRELFVIGLDEQVWAQTLNANGDVIGSYFLTSPGRVKALDVANNGSGRPELFVIGLDDQVWALRFDANGNPVGGYFATGILQINAMSVGHDGTGKTMLFTIGYDEQVQATIFNSNGNLSSQYLLPGRVISISAGSDANGLPELFAIGLDGRIWAQKFGANGSPVGNYSVAANGGSLTGAKEIQVGNDARQNVIIFSRDWQLNNVTVDFFMANGNQPSVTTLAQNQVKALDMGRDASGNPELFVIGLDDQVWIEKFTANDVPVGVYPYSLASPGRVKAISVGNDGSGRAELFAVGLDDQVWALKFDGQGNPVGGYFLTQGGRVLTITGARNPQPVNVIDPGAAGVHGVVSLSTFCSSSRTPVVGATITVQPAGGGPEIARTQTDQNGMFEFHLLPGRYRFSYYSPQFGQWVSDHPPAASPPSDIFQAKTVLLELAGPSDLNFDIPGYQFELPCLVSPGS